MLQIKAETVLDFKGCTVIIPSICVGNAAQLACDLLIASKKLKRVGTLHHAALIPVFGPSAYEHEPMESVAACEIYVGTNEEKLVVFQLRSPLISWQANKFHTELKELVKPARRVIILSTSFGFEKRVIESTPYEYCASDAFKTEHESQLKTVQWKEFKGETIFGGGNALKLYNDLKTEVPVMLLFRYLLEGDNSLDASNMLRELNEICSDFLQINHNGSLKLTVPSSWNLLFGNDAPELMF